MDQIVFEQRSKYYLVITQILFGHQRDQVGFMFIIFATISKQIELNGKFLASEATEVANVNE